MLLRVQLFTLASLFCAMSHTLVLLTIARVVQGCGASGIMRVNAAATEDLNTFALPTGRLNAKRRGICDAIQPVETGGSTNAVLQEAFISWARANLSRRHGPHLENLAHCAKTVDAAGFSVRTPE